MPALVTPEEWAKNPDFVRKWKKTWEQPHMRAGLQVLISLGLTVPKQTPIGEIMQVNALRNALHEGYFTAVHNIDRISDFEAKPQEDAGGWGAAQLNSPPADQDLKPTQ